MAHDGLSRHCRHAPTDGPHECTGCTCTCHPEAIRVSHGAPIRDTETIQKRIDALRAAIRCAA